MKLVEKVSILPVITGLDIPTDRVLQGAIKSNLQGCVVMGYNEDGDLYFASSYGDCGDVLWLIEKAKQSLMEV